MGQNCHMQTPTCKGVCIKVSIISLGTLTLWAKLGFLMRKKGRWLLDRQLITSATNNILHLKTRTHNLTAFSTGIFGAAWRNHNKSNLLSQTSMNSAMKLCTSDLTHVYNGTLLELGAIRNFLKWLLCHQGGDSYNQTWVCAQEEICSPHPTKSLGVAAKGLMEKATSLSFCFSSYVSQLVIGSLLWDHREDFTGLGAWAEISLGDLSEQSWLSAHGWQWNDFPQNLRK